MLGRGVWVGAVWRNNNKKQNKTTRNPQQKQKQPQNEYPVKAKTSDEERHPILANVVQYWPKPNVYINKHNLSRTDHQQGYLI